MKKLSPNMVNIVVVLVAVVVLILGNRLVTGEEKVFGRSSVAPVYLAKVDIILARQFTDPETATELQIFFQAEISSGEYKGSHIARQFLSSAFPIPVKPVEAGDSVMVRYTEYDGEMVWVFQEYNRSGVLLGLIALFIGLLLIFGGKKGVFTMVSLTLTLTCIFFLFLPAILSGHNIYMATIFSCIFIIIVTLILVNGINDKTVAVALGCFGGLLISGILFKVMDIALKMTGNINEDSAYLLIMDANMDLKGIMFGSILIGVLGGVLDVGVSIASSLGEIYPKGKTHAFSDVFKSGMTIGRDIISTMTNTLILVYIGSALPSTLLLIVYSNSFLELINREAILFEILQAVIGSIGLLFTIPITTIIYGLSLSKKEKEETSPPMA